MKPPKRLRVLGNRWDVVVKRLSKGKRTNKFGTCDTHNGLIVLDPRQGKGQMRDTLLHEVLHTIEQGWKLQLRENEVCRIAAGILSFMRDNPQAVKFLMEKE